MTRSRGPIGILSGLGPLAGSDVLEKALEHAATAYGAVEDVDFPDVVLVSHGIDTFDNKGTIGDHFERELVHAVRELDLHRCSVIGVACNTAHLYLAHLRRHTRARIVDLIDEVAQVAAQHDRRYLLLSSSTTRHTGLYHGRLDAYGVRYVDIDDAKQRVVDEVVRLVMGDRLVDAGDWLESLVAALHPATFDGIIAGCTELPLAIDRSALPNRYPIVDSNAVLAHALVDTYFALVRSNERVVARA